MRLEDIHPESRLLGVVPGEAVRILDVRRYGGEALEITYRTDSGRTASQLVYPEQAEHFSPHTAEKSWNPGLDGTRLRLAAEAYRIRLAHLFDPLLAVHTSTVEPLPHQITAVYEHMLSRQPLRFLLADDPGAGKTVMAGLFIKELLMRGDLRRCLVVCPGSLAEQWQDELYTRFQLAFEIMTNDKLSAAVTGNWLSETPLVIARLDKLARDEAVQAKLEATEWDLIVCDEAHKMSASYYGAEAKYTRRYQLGRKLSSLTRHFLLMTATPHNGHEADFQLFMGLLDPDRFEGRYRQGVHSSDASDLMRRLTKEQLVKFDGTPLFPERIAYTVPYSLSSLEAELYEAVTAYVREEFNRAEASQSDGVRGTVGFALTVLQRRLASSPEAIYQSLKRRRERLERKLTEERNHAAFTPPSVPIEPEELEDDEERSGAEQEQLEEFMVDQASAAQTIAELEAEIATLRRLEALALRVVLSGTDRKWEELSSLLQDRPEMFDAGGARRKLVVFTEHRDTLNYLQGRIAGLLGRAEAVVCIHGGMSREERRASQAAFTQDPRTLVLLATDAAGEGINLQRAHLMVNYDLPWNPNRLEQRFGRIHRIGQTEVCHLWNLVAHNTREGEVFERLLRKLEREREALGGRVFDVLGRLSFADRPLRELLVEAVRYGDQPEVRARLHQVLDHGLNTDHLRALLEERALAQDTLDTSKVRAIREDMERAEARRLQPHFVAAFFLEALRQLGGSVFEREAGRYEVRRVPSGLRERARQRFRQPVPERYERITFDKALIRQEGKPMAEFVCPGHPLLEVVGEALWERDRELLRGGAVLVDAADPGTVPRTLYALEHLIQDAHPEPRPVSRQLHFVEFGPEPKSAGYAPYLDYRPLSRAEAEAVAGWLAANPIPPPDQQARQALEYAVLHLMPPHFAEVKSRREALVRKTRSAVRERLTKEIQYWDARANELRAQEDAGRQPRLNSQKARQRADELQARLRSRLQELEAEAQLSQQPPTIVAQALVVPAGLLAALLPGHTEIQAHDIRASELRAMRAVMELERQLGFTPRDVSALKCGYDIESRAEGGRLRFIEVKGRAEGAETVTVTKNEILTALNKPDDFILALVELGEGRETVHYVRRPFSREPDFGATSVNYRVAELLARAEFRHLG